MVEEWRPDILDGFERRDLPLTAEPLDEEPDVPLVATLVRHTLAADPERDERERAVLYVHGWNDYFFQAHLAEFFERQGITFYAVELRRYGRSYRTGQLADYIDDLASYAEEFDRAFAVMGEHHASLSLMGHSTGGLSGALYASTHPRRLDSLILNSPWLDMWGPPGLMTVIESVIRGVSMARPTSALKLPEMRGLYVTDVQHEDGGEWDFTMERMPSPPVPVRFGWVRAVFRGHAQVAAGLDITCPVFIACSTRSALTPPETEKLSGITDTVLDVDKIAGRAAKLGPLVTLVRIPDGIHDLTLSRPPARQRLFRELARWLGAYVSLDAVDDLRHDDRDAARDSAGEDDERQR